MYLTRYSNIVPLAAPSSVSVSEVTSSSITVQWGPVECIHHNGNITGYSVRYREVESGNTDTVFVSGDSETETTITGLIPDTIYSVEVAAVNDAGTGVYSAFQLIKTRGIMTDKYLLV